MDKHSIWVVKLPHDQGFLRIDDLSTPCGPGNLQDMRAFTCPFEARGAAKAVFGTAVSLREALKEEYAPEESALQALRDVPTALDRTVTVWRF